MKIFFSFEKFNKSVNISIISFSSEPMNVLGYFAPNLNIDIKSQEQEENFEEYSETIVNKQGNTLWNLRNGGLIAHQGDWIYYANPEDNNKLYKCKLDHSSKTKICADIVNSINAIGDWIYYIRDKKAIYKIKSNGTNKTEILFEEFSYIYVIKDWIYCVKTQSDMFGINSNTTVVKIKVDGSAREELSYVEDLIYIEENYIYYRNRFTKFYKLDTLNKKEILIGETKGAEHFGCSGPYVINEGHLFLEMEYHNRFLFTDQYSSRLAKLNLNDGQATHITDRKWDDNRPKINIDNLYDDWTYFINYEGIWRCRIGKFGEKALYHSCRNIEKETLHVIDNWLYFYIEEGETKKIARVPIDISSNR